MKESVSSYYAFSQAERKAIILIELFKAKEYITIEYLTNILGVSRGTVIKDLIKIKEWLTSQNLELKSLPHYGLKIKGEEREIRRLIMVFCLENEGIEKTLNIIRGLVQVDNISEEYIKKLFEGIDILFIDKIVKPIQEHLDITRGDNICAELVLYLAITIKRIQLGHEISMVRNELERLKTTAEYFYALNITKKLEQRFNIKFSAAEIMQIALYLLTGKLTPDGLLTDEEWMKIEIIILQLIHNVRNKLDFNFNIDKELCKNLSSHLISAICSLKYGFPINNSMLKIIKRKYSDIFKVVKEESKILEEFVNHKIPEDEIALITLHFAAALERSKLDRNRIYRALLVSGRGLSNTQILASRLRAEFENLDIIGIVAPYQAQKFGLSNEVDIIISTVPMCINGIPTVVVNPLLLRKDILKIKKSLKGCNLYNCTEIQESRFKVEKLIEVIEKHCSIRNRSELERDIRELIDENYPPKAKNIDLPMLKDLLTQETIRVNVEAKDWEDAVRQSGKILVKNGFVESRYTEALIRIAKEVGPYMVGECNIAILHAWPEDGVKQLCMSLIVLSSPVIFENKGSYPVKVVITLGIIDNFSHIKIFLELMEILKDIEKVKLIINAQKIEEVLSIINIQNNKNNK